MLVNRILPTVARKATRWRSNGNVATSTPLSSKRSNRVRGQQRRHLTAHRECNRGSSQNVSPQPAQCVACATRAHHVEIFTVFPSALIPLPGTPPQSPPCSQSHPRAAREPRFPRESPARTHLLAEYI